jgi:hypothetical protein
MQNGCHRTLSRPFAMTALALGFSFAWLAEPGVASAPDDPQDAVRALSDEVDRLRARGEALRTRLDDGDEAWLTGERARELRGIVTDVLADSATRTALQDDGVHSGYDPGSGFTLASNDGGFTLKILGQLQFRWVLNRNPSGQDYSGDNYLTDVVNDTSTVNGSRTAWGFGTRRAKVKFQGTVVDPSWSYQVNGAFGRTTGVFDFEDVMITKTYDCGVMVSVGQFKTPFMREELVSSRVQLAVDRSMVNAFFQTGRGVGVDVRYQTDQFSLEGAYTNGMQTALAGGQMDTNSSNSPTDYAFTGRLQWKLAGEWSQFKGFNAGVDEETAVMIGVAGMTQEYNGNASGASAFALPALIPPAILSGLSLDGSTVNGVTADISAKFGSFSLFASAVWQQYEMMGSGASAIFAGDYDYELSTVNPWGVVLQGGYALCEEVELFTRYAYGDSDLSDLSFQIKDLPALPAPIGVPLGETAYSILTVGGNYFVNDNVKLTVDWGINLQSSLVGVNEGDRDGLGWGLSNAKNQWVLRAQLQLLF